MRLDYAGEDLIFVVGCPRSGTTWVQRLLAGHPKIRTGQESDVFDLYVGPQLRAWRRETDPASSGRGGVGLACYFQEPEFLSMLKRYTLELLGPMVGTLAPGEIFVEKTPSHVLYWAEIVELVPRARFVHVLRDARDAVASLLIASKSWGRHWAPRSARGAAGIWLNHVRAARQAAEALGPNQFHEIRYEQLHADGPRVLAELVEWIGLEWSSEAIADALAANRPEAARSGGGTPIPLGGHFRQQFGSAVVAEPDGFIRKARAGGWREDLSLLQRAGVWLVAHRVMQQVGYPWPLPV
jgi:hypothetical protein